MDYSVTISDTEYRKLVEDSNEYGHLKSKVLDLISEKTNEAIDHNKIQQVALMDVEVSEIPYFSDLKTAVSEFMRSWDYKKLEDDFMRFFDGKEHLLEYIYNVIINEYHSVRYKLDLEKKQNVEGTDTTKAL